MKLGANRYVYLMGAQMSKIRFVVDIESEYEKDIMMLLTELVKTGKIKLTDVQIRHL